MAKEIDPSQLLEILKNGAELVDVRESNELQEGKINNATHWPLSTFGLRQGQVSSLQPTVFYCRSGLRSLKAAEIAATWTSQDVYSLRGGYLAYVKEMALVRG